MAQEYTSPLGETLASGDENGNFQDIRIRTMDQSTHEMRVPKDMLISLLKERISEMTEVPGARQRLIYRGRVMEDDDSLAEWVDRVCLDVLAKYVASS